MAEDTPAAPVAPAQAATPAPAEAEPVAAPVPADTSSPGASPQAQPSTADSSSPSPEGSKPAVEGGYVDTPTFLGAEAKKAPETAKPADAAPAEVKPAEAAKPAEAEAPKPQDKAPDAKPDNETAEAKPDQPKPETEALPAYEKFTLPEGVTLEEAKVGEFTQKLGTIENLIKSGKADHAALQKFGQELIDMAHQESQSSVKRVTEHFVNSWEKEKTGWKEATLNDPQFKNRFETVLETARGAISEFGGTAEQQAEFRKLMDRSGVGFHPAQFRLIDNMQNTIRQLREKYEAESVKPVPSPAPSAPKPRIGQQMIQKRYKDSLP